MRQHLLANFAQRNFEQIWESGEKLKNMHDERNPNTNSLYYQIPNNYNLNLVVNFPGYKTKRKANGNLVYDYRVSLNNISISHVNIIVDLYNKSNQLSTTGAELLSSFITAISIEGNDLTVHNYYQLNDINFIPPSQELLQSVNRIHRNLNKTYLINGNLNWNYSIGELSVLIPLIVLQEDINYPMPRYEGRRMSFYRYLEAIYCGQTHAHSLEEVINRALSHRRPALWNCIDYTLIKNLIE